MRLPELRYGQLEDVAAAVDNNSLNEMEVRSVLLNLIDHIERQAIQIEILKGRITNANAI